jgi:hypothetical protein
MSSFTFIGSFRLFVLPGLTAPATLTTKALYTVDLGEGVGGIKTDATIEDCEVPVAGVNQIEDSDIIKAVQEYSFKYKKLNMNLLSLMVGGPAVAVSEPTTLNVGSNFSNKVWAYIEWYRNGDTAGTPKFKHTGVQLSLSPDGEFSVDTAKHTEVSIKGKLFGAKGTLA